MIYNEKEHYDLVFNEIQELPRFGSGFEREYQMKYYEQLIAVNNGKPVVRVNHLMGFAIGALGLLITVLVSAGLKIALPCGKHIIFHMAAAWLCTFIGFMMVSSSMKQKNNFYKDTLADTIMGIILMAEGIALPIMWFNLPFETDWECSYFMAGTFFLAMALFTVVGLVMYLTRAIRIYTRTVDAECIGYVRKRTYTTDADNHSRTVWYHSPVFRYNLDGREVIAFYDTLARGISSMIPMGPCTIRVNKNDAGSIMDPKYRGIISTVIGITFLILIGIFLIHGVLNGHVSGSGISY
jgi:hypothetical protein